METDEKRKIDYILSRQLPTARAILSDYGKFPLDEELRSALEATFRPILERRPARIHRSREPF